MIAEFRWSVSASGTQIDIRHPGSLTANDIGDIELFLAALIRQLCRRNGVASPAGDKK